MVRQCIYVHIYGIMVFDNKCMNTVVLRHAFLFIINCDFLYDL